MEAGAPASCQTAEEKKEHWTWPNYDDSLYRIIQEIFINLIFVKFVDSLPLRRLQLLDLFSWTTLVAVHVVHNFYFL